MSAGVENLAELINDQGDGREFFARNYMTHGMEQLFREGLLRLSGKSDQAVFEPTQAMGGGKTHMMIALGLLARHPHLRPESLPADLNIRVDFGQARIAAFNGRNNPDHHIWREIASQLGAEHSIKPYWANGPKAVDQRKWKEIIGDRATLTRWVKSPAVAGETTAAGADGTDDGGRVPDAGHPEGPSGECAVAEWWATAVPRVRHRRLEDGHDASLPSTAVAGEEGAGSPDLDDAP